MPAPTEQPRDDFGDALAALSLGVVVGGDLAPAHHELKATLIDAMNRIPEQLPDGDLAVNVIFHLPGSLFIPDFVGLRVGRLSARDRKILLQFGAPERLDEPPQELVLRVLEEAIALAADRLRGRRERWSLTAALDALAQLRLAWHA